MLKLKVINKPKMLKIKCNFKFPEVVLANLQEKEVIPTKEKQEVIADSSYDGLSKVIVDEIPNEYIIPSGNIDITKNGTYDVTNKVSANVSVPEKTLGTKTITTNGIYKASNDNLDGYSEVEVATSGVDINDYYNVQTVLSGYDNQIIRLIKRIPLVDTSKLLTMRQMFRNAINLIEIPLLDCSNVTDMSNMFENCSSLTTIPQLDASNVTSMIEMFYQCKNLERIPLLNTTNVTNMDNMFRVCSKLTTIPQLDTNKVTSMEYTFGNCSNLTTIPQLDTSNVTNMNGTFYLCSDLTTIAQLNANKITNVTYVLDACISLKDFGGLLNLGQAYLTTQSTNYRNYKLNLSSSKELTHDSLMNVINGLYDIKTKGCNTQSLILGSSNISKLSAEELQICTNKGWSVS